jgi:DNA-binding MarR family transcriptional regulator
MHLEQPTPEAVEVLDHLRRIVRVLRESSRAAEGLLGVTGAQLFVLRALAGSPGLSLNDLAARTRTHQSTVSVVVSRLVARGLVRRTQSRTDGRRAELSLSPKGRALLSRAPLAAQDALIGGIERLPRAQRASLATTLRALVRAMKLEDEAPAMFFEENDGKA